MPAVLVALAAVGVALLCLLVAYALTVLFTPLVEGVLRQIPLVGGHLADWTRSAIKWAEGPIIRATNAVVHTLTGWLFGLEQSAREWIAAVDSYLVELPDKLDHFAHTQLPAIVHTITNPIKATADTAATDAAYARAGVDSTFQLPLHVFKGIEAGVTDRLGALRDVVENVDLPQLAHTLRGEIHDVRDYVDAGVAGGIAYTDQEFGNVWDFLNKLPFDQLLALLVTVPAIGALVQTIALEAGLDSAECRGKVRGICSTDAAAWQALLDVAGLALAWFGIEQLLQEIRDFAGYAAPLIEGAVRGG